MLLFITFHIIKIVLLHRMTNAGLLDPESTLRRDLSQYSTVVFSLGPWEYAQRFECLSSGIGRWNATEDFFRGLIQLADQFPATKFLWRTWAGPGTDKRSEQEMLNMWKDAQAHNHLVKTIIHNYQRDRYQNNLPWTQISYIDWGMAMGPRLFPTSKRIKGDIDMHHGFEGRYAFILMWINHLVELERQEHFHLKPWWIFQNNSVDEDCSRAGLMRQYCIERDDIDIDVHYKSFLTITDPAFQRINQTIKDQFCGSCIWRGNIECHVRLLYMLGHYKLQEPEAYDAVMQEASCRKSNATAED